MPDQRKLLAAMLLTAAALGWSAGPARAAAGPIASLTADPVSPITGQAVTFRSTSTPKPDHPIVMHEWDLDGNGTYETNTGPTGQVSHSYVTPGLVVVGLRVSDDKKKPATGVAALPVTVRWNAGQPPPPPPDPNDTRPPNASFIYSPGAPRPGETVTFASTSSDPGGAIAQESWDLNDDGAFGDVIGRTASAAYAVGAHAVSLRVTDQAGNQSVYTQSIEVPPDAGALALPGGRVLYLMRPFPVVRMAGRYYRGGVQVRLLSIAATSTATVRVRCEGRGCGFTARTYRPRHVRASRLLRIRSLERRLRSGTRVVITVTRPGTIGKYTRFRIRRMRPPARVDRCMLPGSGKPIRCPGA